VRAIDEVPALAVAAAFAEGTTVFRQVSELRVKESDRVATVIELLEAIGASATVVGDDELHVHGARDALHPGTISSRGDHRIALAGAVAANALTGESTIESWSATEVSYPGFEHDLESVCA